MSIAQTTRDGIPTPSEFCCPAGCTLSETIECWLRRECELRRDLAEAVACGSADAPVLRRDLVVAVRLLDVLIAYGATGAVRVPA